MARTPSRVSVADRNASGRFRGDGDVSRTDAGDLCIERAQALYRLLGRHRDIELVVPAPPVAEAQIQEQVRHPAAVVMQRERASAARPR